MTSQSDAKTVKPNSVSKAKKPGNREFKQMAEQIIDIQRGRANRRKDMKLDAQWADIDRQIAMIPDDNRKKLPTGEIDVSKQWMAEVEPPLQADALELLGADAKRMMFPTTGHAFEAKSYLDDEFLEENATATIVFGDRNEVPSAIDQTDSNKLVRGYLEHLHNQYAFEDNVKIMNAEAIKYSVGVGRWREAKKNIYLKTAKGVIKETLNIPVFFPKSIKTTYLDDTIHKTMNESIITGGSVIDKFSMRIEDLTMAAKSGSTNPDNMQGGWRPAGLKGIEPDDNGMVETMMFEGDLIVNTGTKQSMFLPGVIITIVIGSKDSGTNVVRFRWRKIKNNTNVIFPYQQDKVDSPYGTAPLMKGRPIQIAAADALCRMMDASALNAQPTIGYDADNPYYAAENGPVIYPGAQIKGGTNLEIIAPGDPAAMAQIFLQMVQQYATTTGAMPALFGSQTKSHTTAFAKGSELTRGTIRTFDYANSTGNAAMTQSLYIEYEMARKLLTGSASFFVDDFGEAVTITKKNIPELADFEWFGASGPAEEQNERQARIESAQGAIALDNLNIQRGGEPAIDLDAMIKELLKEGGWQDVDQFLNIGPENSPGVAGRAQAPGAAPSPAALLQAVAGENT